MLDDAVLAGSVHALQDHQHRPAPFGIKPLLQFAEPLGVSLQHLLQIALVVTKAAGVGGIEIAQPKIVWAVDAVARSDVGGFHGREC
jgi:hypothetical protein